MLGRGILLLTAGRIRVINVLQILLIVNPDSATE